MEALEKVFSHKSMGYAYTRIGNPTLAAFEQRISELEGGAGAVCCSSGMSAITAAILSVCSFGDEIIAADGLYGGTIDLFSDLEKLGIHTVFAEKLTKETVKGLIIITEIRSHSEQYQRRAHPCDTPRLYDLYPHGQGEDGGCRCLRRYSAGERRIEDPRDLAADFTEAVRNADK